MWFRLGTLPINDAHISSYKHEGDKGPSRFPCKSPMGHMSHNGLPLKLHDASCPLTKIQLILGTNAHGDWLVSE